MDNCTSKCVLCAFHETGVYLLNGSSIIIIVLVVTVYWREVFAMCFGTGNIETTRKLEGTPEIVIDKANNLGNFLASQNLYKQQFSPQNQVQTYNLAQPMPSQLIPAINQPTSPQERPNGQAVNNRTMTNKHSPSPAKATVSPPPPPPPPFTDKEDTFKLPKPDPTRNSKESTGSSYFKQMLRGKHPVLSISQYNVKKLNKQTKSKGEKAEGGKKHQHHHHHHKKK